MKKRMLSMFLAIVMVVGILPGFAVTASAALAGENSDEAKWGASANNLTSSGTLVDAIAAAASNSDVKYIQLQTDVTVTTEFLITNGKFTIDLNGFTVTNTAASNAKPNTFNIKNDSNTYNKEAEITFTDNNEDGEGKVVSQNGVAVYVSAYSLGNGIKVTLEKGTYQGNTNGLLVNTQNSYVVVNDGVSIVSTNTYGAAVGVSGGELTMYGGALEAKGYDFDFGARTATDALMDLSRHTSLDNKTIKASRKMPVNQVKLPEGYGLFDANNKQYAAGESVTKGTIVTIKKIQPTYMVTVSATPTEGGTVSGGGSYDENAPVTVIAEAASGYIFTGWKEGETIVSTEASYTFSATKNRDLIAVFEAHVHSWNYTVNDDKDTITATCGNAGGACPDTNGGYVTIVAPTSTEYTGIAIEAKMNNQLTTGDTVNVVYSASEGSALTDDKPVKCGTYTAKITLGSVEISVTYTITHSNHTLSYSNITDTTHKEFCDCGYEATVDHVYDENTHTCACEDVEQFTVTYTDGVEDAEIFSDVVYSVDYNTTTPSFGANVPTRTGYTFNDWTPDIAEKVTGNATYTAQWTAHTYTVKFNANGGNGSMADMSFTYDESQTLTANAFSKTDMHFTGWNTASDGVGTAYENGQSVDNLTAENNGVVVLYAQWADKPAQTITFDTSDRNATYGDGTLEARTATAAGAITYSSDDETVATVDENGVVTVLNAGEAVITATAAETADYASGSVSYKLIVAPKTLTITADSHEVYVGSRQPELTYTIDGLVGTDTLTTAPTLSTDANMYRAGTYAITFASEAAAGNNYSITYVNGTLTVKNYPYIPQPTYDVEIADDINGGEVSASKKLAYRGDTITLTIAPEAGYELTKLTVTDSRGNAVAVTKVSDSKYTFKMPGYDVEIDAVFAKIDTTCPRDWTCPMYGYTNLDMSLWYHDGIHYCIENGLMQGIGDNQFAPGATTTRAMIVTILWRLEGSPVVDYLMDFEDVESDKWYTEAIRWAASEKIVEGYGNGKFGTNDAITREQMVTIMYRYAKYKGYDVSVGENTNILSYDDAFDVAEYAIPAMQWACGSGMIQGIADGSAMNLAPQGNATRAQAAAILQRYVENVANKD